MVAYSASSIVEPADVNTVIERGAHYAVIETITVGTNESGTDFAKTNSFVQLETGLNFQNENGDWAPAIAAFEIAPGAAVAWSGQHKVTLAANANTEGAVVLRQPDGELLRSHVHGLALFNTTSGEAIQVGEIQDAIGLLVAPNQVLYPDALVSNGHPIGDLRYTYTLAGLEQDVILREAPAINPDTMGWDAAQCRWEVWTEFIEAPEPIRKALNITEYGTTSLTDEILDFGSMEMGTGRAFSIQDEDESLSLVAKEWVRTDDNRRFLVETVAVAAVDAAVDELPKAPPAGAFQLNIPTSRLQALKSLFRKTESMDTGQVSRSTGREKWVAVEERKGLVFDYVTYNSTQTDQVFRGDTTYLITGLVNLYGTKSTFEGGSVIKYTNNTANVKVVVNTPLQWGGTPYRPVILTARDDHSVGEKIGTASLAGYYAEVALSLDAATNSVTNFAISGLRVTHAKTGIEIKQKSGHVLTDVQLVNCQNGIAPTSAEFSLRNALFHNVLTNFSGSSSTGRVEHLTANTAIRLYGTSTFNQLFLTNSLLAGVTNIGAVTASNQVAVATSAAGVFASTHAGFNYLASDDYRNVGTSLINNDLKKAFVFSTTYPPLTYTNHFLLNTVLGPVVQRDTDTPDLGYHYPALDYVFSALIVTNATLLLTNGVAVAAYGNLGISLRSGGRFASMGHPTNLNRIIRYESVQEQPLIVGMNSGSYYFANTTAANGKFSLRFTDVSLQANANSRRNLVEIGNDNGWAINIRDSSIRGIYLTSEANSGSGNVIGLINNVIERTLVLFEDINNIYNVHLHNNLFLAGTVTLGREYSPPWSIENNLFDKTVCSASGGGGMGIQILRNAYTSGTTPLPAGTGNRTGLLQDYVLGPLGRYYYPTTGATNSLASLINAETNRTPASIGLYHFATVTTASSKEGTSALDIGFHYVAMNASGDPIDDDGDGTPNSLEDLNGNGSPDSGETDWNSAADFGLDVWIMRPNAAVPVP